jgi:hypothetical protein
MGSFLRRSSPQPNYKEPCHYGTTPGKTLRKGNKIMGKKAKCLRRNHTARTIGDGLDIAQRLADPLHYKLASCVCDACEGDRETRGCESPHACAVAAAARLGQILHKWIPPLRASEDQTTMLMATDDRANTKIFKPPENITTLGQGLRVMTHRNSEPMERPNPPPRRRTAPAAAPTNITVYVAGAVHAPPRKRARAAAGLFIDPDDGRNKGRCVPTNGKQSQYVAELCAVLDAVRNTDANSTLTLFNWEHEGWV